jgi:pentatricopeptide repeat protein
MAQPQPDLAAVFDAVARLQAAYPRLPRLSSPFSGLSFLCQALNSEDRIATAYAVLSERKKAGGDASTAMWNVVLRALALLGNLPAASRMFEGYEGLGVSHDADSYNAVIECCVRQGKLAAAQRLLEYMGAQFVEASGQTYGLLCQGHLDAGDAEGLLRAAAAVQA